MENEPFIKSTPFVEIRDPQINVQDIIREIESKIPLPPASNPEWERIAKMEFQPESPEGYRKFDPAGTAFLFEKGISTPKFTNPKLWFIRGPIKFIFTRIIEFYSLVDKKLSENRIKAFFSVLHELIRLSKRIQNIEFRLENFNKNYLLKSGISSDLNNFDFGWSTFQYFDLPGTINHWDLAIQNLKHKKHVSVLFPAWGYILKELTISKVNFISYTNLDEEEKFIRSKITSQITKIDNIFPLKNFLKPNSDILIFIPLNRFPSFLLEKLFSELSESVSIGHDIYISIQTNSSFGSTPFQDIEITKVELIKLPVYLKSLGFEQERDLSNQSSMKILKYTKVS